MFFVYVLINLENKKTYIGQTRDLQKRLNQHNCLQTNYIGSYTNKFAHNWKYLYVEALGSRREAICREKWFKTGVGREFIRELIELRPT